LNPCWGGTIALRRETLEKLDIRRYWIGAISDDLQMTRALRDHHIKVFSPRQSLLLSPVTYDWRDAFAFGIRQYRIIFTHDPRLWFFAAICLVIPILSVVLSFLLAVTGDVVAVLMLVVAGIAGEFRFRCRRRIASALWPAEYARERLTSPADRFLRPLWWGFHAVCIFAAPFSRRIRWAGIDYLVYGPQDVQIVKADP
jgi:hypothetical protein